MNFLYWSRLVILIAMAAFFATGDARAQGITTINCPLECITVDNIGPAPTFVSVATCPNGYILTGGGGECAQECGQQAGFMHYSAPSGNSWATDCFNATNSGDTPSRSRAVCCRQAITCGLGCSADCMWREVSLYLNSDNTCGRGTFMSGMQHERHDWGTGEQKDFQSTPEYPEYQCCLDR